MRLPRALPLTLALAAACGGRSRPGTSRPGISGDVILADELGRVQASDLWTALQHLRPNWFRRSPSLVRGQGDLLVVVDRVPQGGSDALRQIPIGAVLIARYLSPTEATGLYGQSALYGAIVVSTAPR